MRNFFIMTMLLINSTYIFGGITQGNWRWRKDNGSQTSATWMAAQNTAPVITNASGPLRLRIELYNPSTSSASSLNNGIFQASTDGGISWDTIHVIADANDPFILAGTDTTGVTDMQVTTQQLTSPHNTTFKAGNEIVSSERLTPFTLNINTETEYEFVIKPTPNLKPSATYLFRISPVTYTGGYLFPSLTTASVLPVKITGFRAEKDGRKIKLYWSTASEQNSASFELQRSSDGLNWSTITNVKGSGTSNEIRNYSSYDEAPFDGINYYRLKQYDIDGHFYLSEIRSLKFAGNLKGNITVSPNPVRNFINFKSENISATNVSVSLMNANGRYVYNQIMNTVDAGKMYRLNLLEQQAPGIYILNLKAKELNESIKIIIQ